MAHILSRYSTNWLPSNMLGKGWSCRRGEGLTLRKEVEDRNLEDVPGKEVVGGKTDRSAQK